MAWGDKVQPKDVLGMEPEEFHAKLGKVDAIETRIAAMEAAASASSATILERLAALAPKEPVKEAVDPDVHFLANPSEAIDERLNPLAKQTNDNTIMLMHQKARETYPKDFERWGTEIAQKMNDYAPVHQADPRVWRAVVMQVRGEHAGDIEKDGATGKYSFLEPVSAGLQPDPKSNDGLDADQRRIVSKLRHLGPKELTPEKYHRGVERLAASRRARLGSMGRD